MVLDSFNSFNPTDKVFVENIDVENFYTNIGNKAVVGFAVKTFGGSNINLHGFQKEDLNDY